MIGRLVIEDIRPSTPGGYPAKAVLGEPFEVHATVFADGHATLAGQVELRPRDDPGSPGSPGGPASPDAALGGGAVEVLAAPLEPLGNDRWRAVVTPERLGHHSIVVSAWTARFATWAVRVTAKLAAEQDVELEIAEALALLKGARATKAVDRARRALRDAALEQAERVAPALAECVLLDSQLDSPPDLTTSAPSPLWVDRERALVGAWYELFPRSEGGLTATANRVPELAELGFDVLYLPPVSPIGTTHRKGRNNSVISGPDDPGSPWAIGSSEGGHTEIDAGLGTVDDFAKLVEVLCANGMEIALDYALQCSPDHPWVREHPEWFHIRPDGSIAYAENPPKRYQDIYPINFWPPAESDRLALWEACKEVMEVWIDRGVRIFRVDNPHTKPLAFWAWLLPAIQERYPEVVFLAEAFTRPAMMAKLAEVGFSQSYTYFTWRTRQLGFEGVWEFLDETSNGPAADYMRPNFWPNTPDILSGPLRNGSPAAFACRLVLAATGSPSYGIYSGYEVYENLPASATNEEYLDSEKYQLKARDYSQPGSLNPLIHRLNSIRRRHPALRRLSGLVMHPSDNPLIVAYSKTTLDGSDAVLCVVNLDPDNFQSSFLHLDLEKLGLLTTAPYPVHDELAGVRYEWEGDRPYVALTPPSQVAHVFDLQPDGPA